MLVCYIGKKTAYYNGQSYFPGEVFEAPDEIPMRDEKGNPKKDDAGIPITKPLVLGPFSKLREATKEELRAYIEKNPRYARRLETQQAHEAAAKRKPKAKGGLAAGIV